ncbi:MAG: amidohydrolase family protein [Geminicoccaceae bacterium]
MSRSRFPDEIVDAHHHFWQLGRFPYRWLAPDAPPRPFGDHGPIKRDYLPEDYRRDLDGLPVTASVHVQANCGAADPSDETAWLAGLAGTHGRPDAVVGYANLTAPDIAEVLAAHAAYPICRGIRALVAWDGESRWSFADRPGVLGERDFRRGTEALTRFGFSLDLVVLPGQLHEVAALAAELPELTVIVDHLAMPRPGEAGDIDRWADGMAAVAAQPNAVIKLSGLWTIDMSWHVEALEPFVAASLAAFGAERVMYGSNLPIEKLMCPARRQIEVLTAIIDRADPAALSAVFSQTARRIYRLPAAMEPST